MLSRFGQAGVGAAMLLALGGSAVGQLRIVSWNVTWYDENSTARNGAFATAIYGTHQGRSLDPDVVVGQEFVNAAGVSAFRDMLNAAAGSPGDWAAAPFSGSSSDSALFYRTSKLQFVEQTVLDAGTGASGPPRHNNRYLVRPVGYAGGGSGGGGGGGADLYLYSAHMKAGDTGSDQQRRTPEAQRIVSDIAGLPAGASFMLLGDFNIQSSSQQAYQVLVNSESGGGPLIDPIRTPGDWNNNGDFELVHTQDPEGPGGMDDRHDQILIAASLDDGEGLAYLPAVAGGNTAAAYSMSTWNDPNHSYRAWGNDGTSFNSSLTTNGNTMVGAAVAEALRDAAGGGGHLPVLLELQVPAKVQAVAALDFGQVALGDPATAELVVGNGGDVGLFSRDGTGWGIDDLDYALSASAGFAAPAGSFSAAAGRAGNIHTITMDTSTAGLVAGVVTIASDDPDTPSLLVQVNGQVVGTAPCPCEFGGAVDGVDVFDLLAYLDLWFLGDAAAEFSGDEPASIDVFDLLAYLDCWFAASAGDCPAPPDPTGACCSDGSCAAANAADCLAGGGVYLGDDSVCDGGPCAVEGGLIISEVVDGTIGANDANPRYVEITNRGPAPFTFGAGGIIIQSNTASDLIVDVDLTGVTIPAGYSYVVAGSANDGQAVFESTYGFAADLYSPAALSNGNDRYILTDTADSSNLIDIFGEIGVDGAGAPWEFTDSYAVRKEAIRFPNGGAFFPSEWTFPGRDALETGSDATELPLIQQQTTPGQHP